MSQLLCPILILSVPRCANSRDQKSCTYDPQLPIIEHIYNSLLELYEKCADAGLRGRILQCLGMHHIFTETIFCQPMCIGFLFRAQPSLMTMERSAVIMDDIFASPDEEPRGRLLKIIQEFLISEAAKHSAKQKGT